MKQILLYIWQLPQNLLGLLLIAFYRPYAQIWDRTYVLKDVYKVKKDKSTILVSVYGDKEITTDSIGSPYWVAAVKVSRLVEAQLVTFTIEGNDTGAERIAEIEIDTAKIKLVQAAR